MGRCAEDGQNVLFESTTEQAVELFCVLHTEGSLCRLAAVCCDVHAIYTPDVFVEFRRVAAEISRSCEYAYYERVSDDFDVEVWKCGSLWLSQSRGAREERRRIREMRATVFTQSNARAGGLLWEKIRDFVASGFGDRDFLFEK